MPKQSKVSAPRSKSTASRLVDPSPVEERDAFYCCRCGRKFKKQKTNFPVSQSRLYKGNNGFIPVCYNCVDEMYEHYRDVLGTDMAAMQRVCSKFDIYWDPAIYGKVTISTQSTASRMKSYISKSNFIQFIGRTYDDTLDKQFGVMPSNPPEAAAFKDVPIPPDDMVAEETSDDVPGELIVFWGPGYTPEAYRDLDRRFRRWTTGNVSYAHDDPAQESILKQLCILERRIETGGMTGAKISEDINSYNALMGSANLKPSQKKADAQSSDGTPFGVWIQRWENEQPIPEPDPDFADADGIVRYISIWFLGHLCKTLKIKNSYSRMYEEEIERLRVERPEYAGEDDEEFFQDVFDTGGG